MIMYFTGTGNSKYVAQYLANELDDNCVSLNDIFKQNLPHKFHSLKPYVIVAPIYAWRLPKIIENFLATATFSGTKSIYIIATMGSQSGTSDVHCKKICENNKMEFMGFCGVIMPGNYVIANKMPTREEALQKIAKSEPMIKELAQHIAAGEKICKSEVTPASILKSNIISPLFNIFATSSKAFHASDDCIACEKCADFCPVNNISMVNGKPSFDNNCIACYGCINRCPKQAINIGKKTQNNGRYVCVPFIK